MKSKRSDRRFFKNTANRKRAINLPIVNNRGGRRL